MLQAFLNKAPFFRFLISFVSGIICFILFDLNAAIHWSLIIGYFIILIAYFLLQKKLNIKFLFGIALNAFFFLLGIESCYLHKGTNDAQHYSHFITSKDQRYIGYICEIPQVKERSIKCRIRILKQEQKEKFNYSDGEIIAYIEKKDSMHIPVYGNKIIFQGMPQAIPEPKNPFEFNYQRYLSFKNVFHQLYLKHDQYILDGTYESNALIDFAVNLKTDLLHTLKENGLSGNEFAITAALMLGYDDEISGDLMTAYSHTGTLHVLSVSGLHVGVLFLALNLLLRFPDKRIFVIIKTVIILSCLWFYALLSGLSPSVVRATAMFSFVLFGTIINKKGQIYNSIFASAFIMMLFDPFLIIDTGFQLSYLAVAGIVFFYPYICNWYLPTNKLSSLIWKMFAVSLSAQIITLPLTLYYFHQFPLLFFVANMLVIPLSYVVMFGSVFIVCFSKIKAIAAVLTWVVAKSVWIMNESTIFLDQLKFSYIDGINTGMIDMLLMFVLMILITHALLYKNYISFMASFLIMIFMLGSGIYFFHSTSEQDQLVIFHFQKESKMGLISGRRANYYSLRTKPEHSRSEQTIHNFNTSLSLHHISEKPLMDGFYHFTFADKKCGWLIGGDLSHYNTKEMEYDYLIISGDPRIKNIEAIKVKQFIADGSNSYKTINYLKKKFEHDPNLLWLTKDKGAIIFE